MGTNIKKALLVIVLLLSLGCKEDFRPERYFKTSDSDQIMNASEYAAFKKRMLAISKKVSEDVEFQEKLVDSVVSNDSIILTYQVNIEKKGSPIEDKPSMDVLSNFLNKKLPSDSLKLLIGKNIDLTELEGKPTVINFWFTSCKPCIDEIPVLNKINNKFGDKINFVAITFDNHERVQKFLEKFPFTYDIIIEASPFIDKLGIKDFPKNLFLDKNGIVRRIEAGVPYTMDNGKLRISNGEKFEEYILQMLQSRGE